MAFRSRPIPGAKKIHGHQLFRHIASGIMTQTRKLPTVFRTDVTAGPKPEAQLGRYEDTGSEGIQGLVPAHRCESPLILRLAL